MQTISGLQTDERAGKSAIQTLLALLGQELDPVCYARGSVLTKPEGPDPSLLVLISGTLRLMSQTGAESPSSCLWRDVLTGPFLLPGAWASSGAVAETDVQAYVMSVESFARHVAASTALRASVFRACSDQIAAFREATIDQQSTPQSFACGMQGFATSPTYH